MKAGSLATITCDAGAELEGCTTMKCDTNATWVFHECTLTSSACYSGAVDIGNTDWYKGQQGENDDYRHNKYYTNHHVYELDKTKKIIEVEGQSYA